MSEIHWADIRQMLEKLKSAYVEMDTECGPMMPANVQVCNEHEVLRYNIGAYYRVVGLLQRIERLKQFIRSHLTTPRLNSVEFELAELIMGYLDDSCGSP